MRLLSLTRPDMRGPEVEAWQRFLRSRGLYHDPIDGDFDAAVAAATREYQRESRLEADGVLGPETIEQALRDGFSLPADRGDPHYVAAGSVVLSMEARTALSRIADEYYRETGEVLYVTSGTRTPEKQAEAMYDNFYYGRNRGTPYKDMRAYNEILAAYNEVRRSGASKHATVEAMTRVIERQVARHQYISLHLRGEAVDVRSRDMSYQQERAFQKAVDDVLGLHHWIVEADHYHVQFR